MSLEYGDKEGLIRGCVDRDMKATEMQPCFFPCEVEHRYMFMIPVTRCR